MKFLISVVLIAMLGFISCIYFPWYSIAIFAFLVNIIIPLPPLRAFLSGFTALFVLWAALGWWINSANDGILSHRIAELFSLGGSGFILILITGFIGGLVAGLASLTASFLKKP
jgi:hypothetical protein